MSRNIVISGLGAVCPRAAGHAALWELFPRGDAEPAGTPEPSVSALERIPDAAFEKQPAQVRHMDRLGRISLAATTLAIEDSGLEAAPGEPHQTGIAFGSGYGCLPTNEEYLAGILERGARYGNPLVFQNTVTNAATGYISMVHDLRGPNATLCSGWAAGLEAIRFGCQQIEAGQAERMVVGSADTLSSRLIEGLSLQGWLRRRGAAQPFTEESDGMRVSEAACTLVLEELTQARKRGAHVYAELTGTGHRGGPLTEQARTLARAVRDAVRTARIEPEQLGAVFSGANGHRDFDGWEYRGLHEALGAHAARIPVTCPKAVLGETFSAAGTLAVLLGALAVDTGWVPGIAGRTHPTPGCQLNLISGAARRLEPEWVLVTALGGEGSALAVVLRRCHP
ncbi:beta-ketoacyl-[acyl-carrier-protein] synthase family protein [Pyxidicoccus sp. MSG2]|uniref:beta-ketoacyl-[acyl-carrier-protein] synthase family protein n=1 Tax=Pyxidicoccus sp. MSG2 TaxID=2996790 RepID=UPI00226DEA14|nr:beta-ketoacyl synthase N-terminal-like domain-containing protein [Pyxidicoccus sp. MSG2]MCY1014483.1 beta-ketoacyl synthase N-terminal-like domain-containing protein [Pyxidicoccus sp. MSG2]